MTVGAAQGGTFAITVGRSPGRHGRAEPQARQSKGPAGSLRRGPVCRLSGWRG